VNNLGGISNVTSLDWRHGTEPRVQAFDTGPANVLIDLAVRELTRGRQSHDDNGGWAARGRADEALLSRWLAHPFFKTKPPKSTGRELFGETFWRAEQKRLRAARLSKFDVLATLTEFTARSLAFNYELHLASTPERVALCGGGAKNPALVGRIRAALKQLDARVEVSTSQSLGWPVDAIEAAAFALLAYYRRKEWPGNIPETTGASRAVLLGQETEVT
jgi:anhydro-N-acetylmuramic acid kinase